jgi:hypothetical protein
LARRHAVRVMFRLALMGGDTRAASVASRDNQALEGYTSCGAKNFKLAAVASGSAFGNACSADIRLRYRCDADLGLPPWLHIVSKNVHKYKI